MPLPMPVLDDRRWADLVEEGRALIPRYAPGWTNHNVADPGITILELLAWVVEADLYRVNRVTERHRRKFLALVGLRPDPPTPARVTLAVRSRSGAARRLPRGTVFWARQPGSDQPTPFRLTADLEVTNLAVAAVQVAEPSSLLAGNVVDRTAELRGGQAAAAFGPDPDGGPAGPALLLGLAAGHPVPAGVTLTLAVVVSTPAGTGTEQDEMAAADIDPRAHHGSRTVWEWYDGAGWRDFGPGEVDDRTRSLTLTGEVRLRLPATWPAAALGTVAAPLRWLRCRLAEGRPDVAPQISAAAADAGPAVQAVAAWSTFRVAPGVRLPAGAPVVGSDGPAEIRLDDSGRVIAFSQPVSTGVACTVLGWRPPVGPVDGELRLTLVDLGRLRGEPGESVALPGPPVLPATLRLTTVDPVAAAVPDRVWTDVPDFDAVDRARAAYTLDPQLGTVVFGDGEHGRTADPGSRAWVRVDSTSAAAGTPSRLATWELGADDPRNPAVLGAGTDLGLARADLAVAAVDGTVRPGADAAGLDRTEGAAAETIWAHDRLLEIAAGTPASLDQVPPAAVLGRAAPQRACTLVDFERLALTVPGTAVARARAWAGLDTGHPCLSAPGTVTVVVVPSLPAARPEPSAGLLRTVGRYLAARRTLGTRLVVVGPQYVEVTATLSVRPLAGADPARVVAEVRTRLQDFLHPLRGGPGGLGWPFGRDVQRSEILQQVDEVPGVDHVVGLALVSARPGCPAEPGGCGGVVVEPTMLVTSGRHQVEVV